MKFSINSLILWPRNRELGIRTVPFAHGKVNILTGASKTGKSAIIPIIDYCLGSGNCTIPVGIIRDTCEWFGVLFDLDDEQMLLCRKEPGSQKQTNEMYLLRDKEITVPDAIDANNITSDQVKNTLNELFQLPFSPTDTSQTDGFSGRPSYRDLIAFNFQPQNVIANNRVLFYGIEEMKHKNKLVAIFPFVLGAETADTLAARQEKDRLEKDKERIERELASIKKVAESWKQDVLSWLSQSRELGLTEFAVSEDTGFSAQVEELRKIVASNDMSGSIIASNLRDTSEELLVLRKKEQELSQTLSIAKHRYQTMSDLAESKKKYEKSLSVQKDRLDISGWLRSLAQSEKCPICGESHSGENKELSELCEAMTEIEREAGIVQGISLSFDREFNIVKEEIDDLVEQLSAIRRRIVDESTRAQINADTQYTLAGVARFIGRMEFAIKTYERIGVDGELESKLSELKLRIDELNKQLGEFARKKRIESALAYIQNEVNNIVKHLDTEYPDDLIEFDHKNLTIKIKTRDGRENYLWEIGSASNWLSYHLAVSLAFQKFFQERNGVSVPNFLIFDQPSQVYFPQRGIPEGTTAEQDANSIRDEDKEAVKKIFAELANYLRTVKSELQVIVMEHADEDIWGEYDKVSLVERWRDGNKLVPQSWITESK
jgi:hypothetical protein